LNVTLAGRCPGGFHGIQLANQDHTKRGIGCTTLNRSTYSSSSLTFDILCNQYRGGGATKIHYSSLISQPFPLVSMDVLPGIRTIAINVSESTGLMGLMVREVCRGSLCRYLWTMRDSDEVVQDGEDSARLQVQYSFCNFHPY
jgi:hypothetical protein